MKDIATGEKNWFDMMDPEVLIDLILGNPFVRTIVAFFQILSAISGLVFLVQQLKKIRPCLPKLDITIKGPKTDTFDEWNDALKNKKEDEIPLTQLKSEKEKSKKLGKIRKAKNKKYAKIGEEDEDGPPPYFM